MNLNTNNNNNNFNINNRPYSNIEYLSNFTNYNLFNFMRHNNNKNKDINNKNISSKRKNTMNNKKKQNITIKNAVININMFNMFEPKLFLSSYNNQHHKSQSKPHSIINSMPNSNINRKTSSLNTENTTNNNFNYNNKTERKKPELKFNDIVPNYESNNFNSNSGYTEKIVKTQENYQIKSTNRKNYFDKDHFNINYKTLLSNNPKLDKKHNKINSMKLGEFYKNNLKNVNNKIYSLNNVTLRNKINNNNNQKFNNNDNNKNYVVSSSSTDKNKSGNSKNKTKNNIKNKEKILYYKNILDKI